MTKPSASPPASDQSRTPDGLLTRAEGKLTSFNAEARTVEIVLATETPVERRWSREIAGPFLEVLAVTPTAIDTSRLNSLALLDGHDTYSGMASRMGSIVPDSLRFEGTTALVTAKISRNPAGEALFRDLEDGHVLAASVGYRIHTHTRSDAPGKIPTIRATRWAPAELSIVSVGADHNATTRSLEIESSPTLTTPDTTTQTRGQINEAIRAAARAAGQTEAWANAHIDAEADIATVNAAALAALAARSVNAPSATQITIDHTDPTAVRSAMSDALAHRLAPNASKLEGRAVEFRSHSLLDMVADIAIARGEKVNIRDREDLLQRAVGAHSTSDFPLLLADATNKAVLPAYQLAQPTYRRWSARRTFNNFSDHNFLRIGDFPAFKPINEGGEVKYGSISETGEKIQVQEFTAGFALTRRAIVQDSLGELADFSAGIANRAAADENRWMYAMLAANGQLRDGTALFHASHGNLNPAAALSVASVGVAVASLRKQKSADGLALNLIPAVLAVGPDNELAARQILAQITATKPGDHNPWSNAFDLVIDANITGNEWYVLASPDAAPTFVHGWLAGEEGPQIRTEVEFDTRSVKVAANLTFGHGAVDFRGAQKVQASS